MTKTHNLSVAWLGFVAVLAAVALFTLPSFTHAEGGSHASSTASTTKTTDIACMQTAVDARETSVATAWTTFNTSMTSALSARKTALHDAWGMSDRKAREAAIKEARKNYRAATKSAHMKLFKARKTAWATFKTAAKECKMPVPNDESVGADSAGSVNI